MSAWIPGAPIQAGVGAAQDAVNGVVYGTGSFIGDTVTGTADVIGETATELGEGLGGVIGAVGGGAGSAAGSLTGGLFSGLGRWLLIGGAMLGIVYLATNGGI